MGGGGGGGGGSCDNPSSIMPEDVLIQILLWLPVISLLRFKSVCKSWRAIIDSPFFINLHTTSTLWLSSSSSKLGGSSLLFDTYFPEHQPGDVYDFDALKQKNEGKFFTLFGEMFQVFEDLGRPSIVIGEIYEQCLKEYGVPESSVEFLVVGCSVNGIICLHDITTRNIALWNPAIKQTRILPKPSNVLGNPNCHCVYGDGYCTDDFVMFGMDVKTMDYKLLLITTLEPAQTDWGTDDDDDDDDDDDKVIIESLNPRRVHVYTSSTDSWRCIDTTITSEKILQNVTISAARPNLSLHLHEGIYLNGTYIFRAYCFIEGQENCYHMCLLLSFDFTEEIFTNIQPPYDWRNRNVGDEHPYFIPFGEKLALVDIIQDSSKHELNEYEYNIWVLNDQHDVKGGLWTKFYTIVRDIGIVVSYFKFRCITNDGEFAIVSEERGLQLFNLITRETKDIQFHCPSRIPDYNIYKPSLVPIVGGNGASHN